MAKHILADVEGFERCAGQTFFVDPKKIIVVNGWNKRTDFSGEDELMESIKSVGVKIPLIVKKTTDKTIELVDGERRLRATLLANSNGAEIKVPVTVKSSKTSELDLYLDMILANTGKPFTPIEEANSFKRLVDWGLKVKEISTKTGRSETHVRNRLELCEAIPVVKSAVDNKEISVLDAREIVKDSEGSIDKQVVKLEDKKKEKLSPKIKRQKPLVITLKDSSIMYSGDESCGFCQPIEDILLNEDFILKVKESGFDIETIKITIATGANE